MGLAASRSETPKLLDDIVKNSKYQFTEVQQFHAHFNKEYGDFLTKDQFRELYAKLYPKGNAQAFADQNFRRFDINNDGKIQFKEFMISLGVQCRGTTTEKMDWMFSLFDIGGNGVVSKDEMLVLIQSMYRLKDGGTDAAAQEHVEKIYKALDKNKDGELTKDEFVKLGNTDPDLVDLVCGLGQK